MLDGKYYSHDLMLEKALNFIDENAQKPFSFIFQQADLDIMGDDGVEGNFENKEAEMVINRSKIIWLIWIKVWA